eukprot:CAMPEP_0206003904 /NCGR_PEP_ID=MMETSP1464-20131121/3662_1 /ASSEMBLY_ACC=CAM_ASM_001124 /TAXON_ID=119497 /ORGANISM="Exanthemachrysis gayraliae, Strain RCC1523" /LENGTH=139 /DNA_ID=CAMNT_0053377297 /DNA_START=56 /DNA_END=475 /DNA_ORIENTATION=+
MSAAKGIGCFALGFLAHALFALLFKRNGHRLNEKAWLLVVRLEFVDQASIETFLPAFKKVAAGVERHEKGTLAYEISRSDKNPLHCNIFERYASKDAFVDEHRKTTHFQQFRPTLQALQDAGKVKVAGESWQEMGIGFM